MVGKLKGLKEKLLGDKKLLALIIAALIGTVLVVLSEFMPKNGENKKADEGKLSVTSQRYAETLEKKLAELISSIDGAGNAKVMLTIDTGEENVYARQVSSKDENSETKEISSCEYEYIVIKSGSSAQSGMLLKVVEPNVRGVAVVCEGGDDPYVKEQVIRTVCAVLKIKSNNISVCKMKK